MEVTLTSASMTNTSTERARASAWQSWESWCHLNGYAPLGSNTPLAEYLLWLVDPYGGALSAASASLAHWAVRSQLLKSGWRDPARDPAVRAALKVVRRNPELSEPRRLTRRFTREEIERITSTIEGESLRGLRDSAMLWLGYEGSLRAGELTELRWRHVEFQEFDVTIKIVGRTKRTSRVVTLYESEEPLVTLLEWHEVRPRRLNEPVFTSIPWSENRVSSAPLSTSDVSRIVAKRSLEAGLWSANASALVRRRSGVD